jgi:hypothetical protein
MNEEYTEFIHRIRQRDEQAAEELVRRYEPLELGLDSVLD